MHARNPESQISPIQALKETAAKKHEPDNKTPSGRLMESCNWT